METIVPIAELPKIPRVRTDDENMEKIHGAARQGQTEQLQVFVTQGIDPFIPNRFGCTTLHLACKFGHAETAKYLASLNHVPTNAWHGQKPLLLAVLSNNQALVTALVDGLRAGGKNVEAFLNECDDSHTTEIGEHHKVCEGQTALHWCVGLGETYLGMLSLLVKLGASPTAKDKAGETPLMRAIEFHFHEAFNAMLEECPNPKLLRWDGVDKKGASHLHWAIRLNEEQIAVKLMSMGHDLNVEDEAKTTPLYLAVQAAMPTVVQGILASCDPFVIQQAPFHNGSAIIPDRITWLDFADSEEARAEVIRLFNAKLDEMSMADGDPLEKTKKKQVKMDLAPSAPIKRKQAAAAAAAAAAAGSKK